MFVKLTFSDIQCVSQAFGYSNLRGQYSQVLENDTNFPEQVALMLCALVSTVLILFPFLLHR
jgi:hypothetical protein